MVSPIKFPEKYTDKDEVTLDERGINMLMTESLQAILKRITNEIESTSGLSSRLDERFAKPDKLIAGTINYYKALNRYRKAYRGDYPSNKGRVSLGTVIF
jgi:hypothetical protein